MNVNMKCVKNCVSKVEKYLNGNPSVLDFDVSLKEKRVLCIHTTTPESIMEGIRGIGKTPELVSNEPFPPAPV